MKQPTQSQKKYLKGLAHNLKPIVQVGKEGFSEKLIAETNAALKHHELIKVQFLESSGLDRKKDSLQLAQLVDASVIKVLGFKITLFRPNPEKSKIELPV